MRNILFRTSLIVSLVVLVSVPAFAQMKIGDSPTSITTGAQLDIEKSGSRTVFMDTGKVGIGDVSPASLLTVGSGDLFQVDSTGNIVKINNVTTSFPSSQGSAGTILTNNGSGTLTWSAPAGISADSLNFTDLSDSLLLDASTDIFSSGTNVLSVTNSGTGLSLRVNDDGTLTDATPFVVDASGNVGIGDSTPAALLTVGSGDLFQVNSSGLVYAPAGTAAAPAYSFVGDTNTGLYNVSADVTSLATGGTERLRVNASGNVGVNLATYSVNGINPNHSLVVSGGTTAVLAAVLNTNSGTTNVTTGLGFSVNDVPIGKGGVLFERTGGWGLGKLHLATSSAADNSTNVALSDAKLTVDYLTGNVGIGATSPTGKLSVTQTAAATGALTGIVYTGAVNTNQTLSTEIPSLTLTTAGRQWATGALTTQREVLITQPTYSFVGASTITDAATVGIAGAPIKSTNASITNTHGLLVQAGAVSTATNSYGITVNAQTGATNNYSAAFLGGNVGIGTAAPTSTLQVQGTTQIFATNNYNGIFATPGTGTYSNLAIYAGGNNPGYFPVLYMGSHRNYGPFGDQWSGYTLGDIQFQGYGNSAFRTGAKITSIAESTFSATNYHSKLSLFTTASGSTTPVENLTILGSGNVGIGNTNPTFKLDVLSGTINTGTGGYGANPGALAVTAPDLAIGAAGGSMLFTSNSDFGIDKGGSIALGGRYATGSANDTVFAKVKGAKETSGSSNQGGYLAFATYNHNAGAIAERVRIDSSGNLGVGTTSPAGKVQVVTTSDTTPSTVTAWDVRHLTVGATGSTGSGVGISYDQTNNRGYISAASPNNTWRDLIIGAGTANVGIGMTTAPAAKLTVSGGDILLDNGKKVYMASITNGAGYFFDGSSAWGLRAYNSGSNYYTDVLFDSTGGSGSNSRGIRLMDFNGSAVRLFVGDTGNVGVGNTNPGYLLHVGSSSVTDGTTVLRLEDANSTCSFTANTGAPTCGSDETLKKNITDLGGSLSKIDALRLVEYNWKTDAPGTVKQTGFVAQEVEKVFPKLVSEQKWIDGTNKKFLETAGLVPYLVGATQELSVRTNTNTSDIQSLKKENAGMKAEISDLKTRLESLEQKLK